MSLDSIVVPAGVEVRLVERFLGYAVGSDGSMWSRWLKGRGRRLGDTWKKLACGPNAGGYPQVNLSGKIVLVHWIVAEVFLGPCPEGLEVCHEDGNPGNCAVSNLRYDTHAANLADRERHGTMRRGADCSYAKLTNDDVREIRRLFTSGKTRRQIADVYKDKCGYHTISAVVARRSWDHVD